MEHYFTNNKNLKENINEINAIVKDTEFVFYTDNGVFNKKGLDYGTRVLLENIDLSNKLSFFKIFLITTKLNSKLPFYHRWELSLKND